MSLYLDFNFLNNAAFWIVAIAISIIIFFIGFYFRDRIGHVGRLIREANLRTKQIRELEKINQEFEAKNRELYAKELELSMANKQLESLETAKSKFVSVTTHQLRTPLAAIKWTFDMAIKGQLGATLDEQKKFLEKGFESTERVISIVNDLLRIDSIETNKTEYVFQPTDLVELVENVIAEFSNQAKGKQIELVFNKSDAGVPFVEIDADKIRIVLESIIDNAIKYNSNGGKVTIELDDSRVNTAIGSVQVSITDSGIGIPHGEEGKIFQKFFRATNAIKQEPDGSGLGLYIAQDIIEKHNGAMWFEKNKDGGTTFYFTLPLHQKKV